MARNERGSDLVEYSTVKGTIAQGITIGFFWQWGMGRLFQTDFVRLRQAIKAKKEHLCFLLIAKIIVADDQQAAGAIWQIWTEGHPL